jgi:hypothetical protein
MPIPSFLTKVLKFIGSLFVRAGFDKFLKDHMELAIETVTRLAIEQNNAPLHEWKDKARELLKTEIKTLNDNWIELILGLAYETFKAKQQ